MDSNLVEQAKGDATRGLLPYPKSSRRVAWLGRRVRPRRTVQSVYSIVQHRQARAVADEVTRWLSCIICYGTGDIKQCNLPSTTKCQGPASEAHESTSSSFVKILRTTT
jgi:hypothetical protein